MSKLRAEKLQALIKQELSNMLLREVKDPRVKFVTITGVEVTNELSYAKIYVSFMALKNSRRRPGKAFRAAWDISGRKLPNASNFGWRPI